MSAFKDLLQQAEVLLRQATNGSQGQADDLRQMRKTCWKKSKPAVRCCKMKRWVKPSKSAKPRKIMSKKIRGKLWALLRVWA